jgi:hypothetical protein
MEFILEFILELMGFEEDEILNDVTGFINTYYSEYYYFMKE